MVVVGVVGRVVGGEFGEVMMGLDFIDYRLFVRYFSIVGSYDVF